MASHGVASDWLGLVPANQEARIRLKMREVENAFTKSLLEGNLEPRGYLEENHHRLEDLLKAWNRLCHEYQSYQVFTSTRSSDGKTSEAPPTDPLCQEAIDTPTPRKRKASQSPDYDAGLSDSDMIKASQYFEKSQQEGNTSKTIFIPPKKESQV